MIYTEVRNVGGYLFGNRRQLHNCAEVYACLVPSSGINMVTFTLNRHLANTLDLDL